MLLRGAKIVFILPVKMSPVIRTRTEKYSKYLFGPEQLTRPPEIDAMNLSTILFTVSDVSQLTIFRITAQFVR